MRAVRRQSCAAYAARARIHSPVDDTPPKMMIVSESTASNAMEWRSAGQGPCTLARVWLVHLRVAELRDQKSSLAFPSAASTQSTVTREWYQERLHALCQCLRTASAIGCQHDSQGSATRGVSARTGIERVCTQAAC